MVTAAELAHRLKGHRAGKDHWMCKCPCHEDRQPSLSITQKGHKVLLHCFGGCKSEDVLHAMGLEWSELFDDPLRNWPKMATPVYKPNGQISEEMVQSIWSKEEKEILGSYAIGESADILSMVPDLVWFDAVEPRPISWLWWPYIPFSMLSLLSGDPGAGKSFVMLDLAAEFSQGRTPDGNEIAPVTTVYLTIENPIAEVLVPRFISLGGDRSKICLLRGVKVTNGNEEESYGVTLKNIELLEEAICDTKAGMLVIDPIQSYIGADVDIFRTNQTRPILDRLVKLVERQHCAMPLLRHLNKNSGGKAIYRGHGSIDFTGVARTEMLVGASPDDPQKKALIHVKSNLGPLGKSRGYVIEANGQDAFFHWTGDTKLTEADILAAPVGGQEKRLDAAEGWLRELLAKEEKTQKEVAEAAKQNGFTWATVRRARDRLGVESKKRGLLSQWYWKLPKDEDAQGAQIIPIDKI